MPTLTIGGKAATQGKEDDLLFASSTGNVTIGAVDSNAASDARGRYRAGNSD